jgi:predicted nucleic acid-binding protein
MNGKRLLLDTNAIVALLKGNDELLKLMRGLDWIGISIISQIEFLCFQGLTEPDRKLFEDFIGRIEVVGLQLSEKQLTERAIEIRRLFKVKLPDAIIAATALTRNASLVTADQRMSSIANLPIVSF